MSGVTPDVRDELSEFIVACKAEAIVLYSPWGSLKNRRFLQVDGAAVKKLRGLTEIFPFYMPFFMSVLKSFSEIAPDVPQYVYLGNSFFNTLYRRTIRYAVAEPFLPSVRSRCQGRHGLFHEYHAHCMKSSRKLISIVFDTQTTVCGMYKGVPRTISTGGTPLEGVMGRSSCGDVDPGIPFYLMRQGYSLYAVDELLKKKSGFKGLCGYEGTQEEIFRMYGIDRDVTLAVDVYLTHVLKYIGEAMAVIGGMDGLVFGGPQLPGFTPLIHMIGSRLSFLGVRSKPGISHLIQGCSRISTPESEVLTVEVDEPVGSMIGFFFESINGVH